MILPLPIPFSKRMSVSPAARELESDDALSGKVFDGIKLRKFTPMRQVVSLSLGASGARCDRMNDAILIVWLCSLSEQQVARASLQREQAFLDAHRWAVEHDATLLNFGPIVAAYTQLMIEIDAPSNAANES